MLKFKAIIEGQNFRFMLDDEPQYLDFHRTVCVEAESLDSASERAMAFVMAELSMQHMLPEERAAESRISLGHIEQVDVLDKSSADSDFIWYFPEDAVFEHTLK